jgi:hypothetical protein
MFPAISSLMPESRKALGLLKNVDTASILPVLEPAGIIFWLAHSLLCTKCSGTGRAEWVSLPLGEESANS